MIINTLFVLYFLTSSITVLTPTQASSDFGRTCDIRFRRNSILGPNNGTLKYVDATSRVITLVNEPSVYGIPFGIAVRNASGTFDDLDAPQGQIGDVGAPGVGHDGINGTDGGVGNDGFPGNDGFYGHGLTYVLQWSKGLHITNKTSIGDFVFVQNQSTGMITGIKMNRLLNVFLGGNDLLNFDNTELIDVSASFDLVNQQLNVSGVLASQANDMKLTGIESGIGWVSIYQFRESFPDFLTTLHYIDTLTVTNIDTDNATNAADPSYFLISFVPVANTSVLDQMNEQQGGRTVAMTFTWVAPAGVVGQHGPNNLVTGPPASTSFTIQPNWWNFDKFYSNTNLNYDWTLVNYRLPNPISAFYTPEETLLSFYSVLGGYSAFMIRATIIVNATTPSSFALASSVSSPALKTTPFMRITTDVQTPGTGNQNTFTFPHSSFIYPENTDIGVIWHSELSPELTEGFFNIAASFLLFSNALPSIYTTYQANISTISPVSLRFWNSTGSFIAGGWGNSVIDSVDGIDGDVDSNIDSDNDIEPSLTSYTTVMVQLINNDVIDHNFTVTYISNYTQNSTSLPSAATPSSPSFRITTLVPSFASATVDLGIYLTQDILDITVQTLSPPTTSYVCSAFLTAAMIPGQHVISVSSSYDNGNNVETLDAVVIN